MEFPFLQLLWGVHGSTTRGATGATGVAGAADAAGAAAGDGSAVEVEPSELKFLGASLRQTLVGQVTRRVPGGEVRWQICAALSHGRTGGKQVVGPHQANTSTRRWRKLLEQRSRHVLSAPGAEALLASSKSQHRSEYMLARLPFHLPRVSFPAVHSLCEQAAILGSTLALGRTVRASSASSVGGSRGPPLRAAREVRPSPAAAPHVANAAPAPATGGGEVLSMSGIFAGDSGDEIQSLKTLTR